MVTSLLLLLPAELREVIYQYAVIEEEALNIIHPTIGHSNRPSIRVSQPALSRVNRQLRSEVLPIFYSQNDFQLPCSLSFKARSSLDFAFPRDRPGWLQRETAGELHLIQFMGYAQNVMRNLDTTRKWLGAIGEENQRVLGEVVLCCSSSTDGAVLKEMGSMRFNYNTLQVTASHVAILEPSWVWGGEFEMSRCRMIEENAPARRHYLLRFQG